MVFVIELIFKDMEKPEYIFCNSIEEYKIAKQQFENDELQLKLYELKEVKLND